MTTNSNHGSTDDRTGQLPSGPADNVSNTDNIGANARITAELTSWPGVTADHGERGEWAFRLGRIPLGHLHGDVEAHFVLPKPIWRELREAGRLYDHPYFRGRPGWGARRIHTSDDVLDVIAIFRDNYQRAAGRL